MTTEQVASSRAQTVIEPAGRLAFPSFSEVWRERDLLYLLVRRDVSVRYKQSAVGGAWAVLQPVLFALVLSVFLRGIAKVPSEVGVPYAVFALSGMTLWLFFTSGVTRSSESTVQSAQLISKVYFPRVIIPLAAVIPPLVDFLLAFCVLLGAILITGVGLQAKVLLVPFLLPIVLMLTFGVGLWLSALHVRYRDVQILVPFLIQIGLFVTPIVYPLAVVPHSVRALYGLNPMVGVLETFRWMVFPGYPFPGVIAIVPVVAAALLVVTGALYFHRAERTFADVV
jgi:lipopolysaccharide transport system permease protein